MLELKKNRLAAVLTVFAIGFLFADLANGDDRFWIGGDGDWVNGVGVGFWSPLNDEPDSNDVAIFNTSNNVELGSDNVVAGLSLSGGVALKTGDFFLDVNGPIFLSGNDTDLTVGVGVSGDGLPVNGLDGGTTTIGGGSTLTMGGTRFDTVETVGEALVNINQGGTLRGKGTLRNTDSNGVTGTAFKMLTNNGTLSAGFVPFLGSADARTLTISANDADARIDLDGFRIVSVAPFVTAEDGVVSVPLNQTLDIDVPLSDTFNGTINLRQESRLDIEDAWSLSAGGRIDVDNGLLMEGTPPFVFSTPAGNATIAGGTLTQTGGLIDVVDSDGTLTVEANFLGNGGTLDNTAGGTVVFQGSTVLNNSHSYLLGGTARTSIDGGTTTVNDDNLDFDGTGGGAGWTVTNGGVLNVLKSSLSGAGSNDSSADLFFDNGRINVDVDGQSWTSSDRIQSDGGGKLIGDRVLIGNDVGLANADLDINGGTLQIAAPVTLLSDANVNVAAGATLIINHPDTLVAPVNGSNNGVFTGTGSLFIRGAQFDEATTFNFSGGTVGLDGPVGSNSATSGLGTAAADTDVNADLTINAATFDNFGFTQSFVFAPAIPTRSDLNIANAATLTINLDDPNASWNVLSNGIINYNGNATPDNFLTGSDMVMNGTLNVNGDGRVQARMDIGGTININSVGEFLRLNSGGGTHTLAGGFINGPGTLLTESDDSLIGNGVINANVDFNGSSELIASDGLLDVNGNILDVRTLRSNGAAAVLDLQNAFNSNISSNGISVDGGRIQGNTITLSTRNLRGNGTVLNQVINDNTIAAQGGTLILDNPDSDWDGAGNAGTLYAQTGDLTIRDTGGLGFAGTVRADLNRTVFVDGFSLFLFETLDLNGGTYRSTHVAGFFGSIDAIAGQTSTIDTPATDIQGTMVQLNGDLHIVGDSTIDDGATFAGGGRLVNVSGIMTAAHDANIGVFLENRGTFSSIFGVGRIDVSDYLQTAAGTLELDLETTVPGEYDQLFVSGNAELAGDIKLDKKTNDQLDAYDTVSVLLAGSGVLGTFDTVTGITGHGSFALNEGLAVTYTANLVDVTRALLGDANLDMTVNVLGDAFTLVGNLGTASGATWADGDFTGDGAVDVLGDAFLLVGNLGATASSSPATTAVPEQGSVSLLSLLGMSVVLRRRRR